jgi:hypothetical protein
VLSVFIAVKVYPKNLKKPPLWRKKPEIGPTGRARVRDNTGFIGKSCWVRVRVRGSNSKP